ncbi:hypothetical protein LZG04_20165 [Saccharothrix sp. S26]|nr:hypothetical protein [Saccharothrix sp. S26]
MTPTVRWTAWACASGRRRSGRTWSAWVFAVDDGTGNVAVVSVVWVSFGDRTRTKRFRRLIDVHGTGDIRPLGSALLDLADVRQPGASSRTCSTR